MRGDSQTITNRIGVSPTSVAGTLKSWFEEGLPWEGRRLRGRDGCLKGSLLGLANSR